MSDRKPRSLVPKQGETDESPSIPWIPSVPSSQLGSGDYWDIDKAPALPAAAPPSSYSRSDYLIEVDPLDLVKAIQADTAPVVCWDLACNLPTPHWHGSAAAPRDRAPTPKDVGTRGESLPLLAPAGRQLSGPAETGTTSTKEKPWESESTESDNTTSSAILGSASTGSGPTGVRESSACGAAASESATSPGPGSSIGAPRGDGGTAPDDSCGRWGVTGCPYPRAEGWVFCADHCRSHLGEIDDVRETRLRLVAFEAGVAAAGFRAKSREWFRRLEL